MAVEIFTSSGTWVCPAGLTTVEVECWGGGGSGCAQKGGTGAFRGGGGGGYSKKSVPVTPSATYTYAVGTGGAAVSAPNVTDYFPGNAGGDTWFSSPSTILAKGGQGGDNSTGGQGGQASDGIGDTKYSGGNGGNPSSGQIGGGGSGAGNQQNGNNGSVSSGVANGGAAATNFGGQGGQSNFNSTGTGTAGSGFTIGGGGGSYLGGNFAGVVTSGSGAPGELRISYPDIVISDTTNLSDTFTALRARNTTQAETVSLSDSNSTEIDRWRDEARNASTWINEPRNT